MKKTLYIAATVLVMLVTSRFVVRIVDAYASNLTQLGHYACVVCPENKSAPFNDERLDYDVFRVPAFRFSRFGFDAAWGLRTRELRRSFSRVPPVK